MSTNRKDGLLAEMRRALEMAEEHLSHKCPDRYNGGHTLETLVTIRAVLEMDKAEPPTTNKELTH